MFQRISAAIFGILLFACATIFPGCYSAELGDSGTGYFWTDQALAESVRDGSNIVIHKTKAPSNITKPALSHQARPWFVQIIAISDKTKAEGLAPRIREFDIPDVRVEPTHKNLFAVRAGRFRSKAEASLLLARLTELLPSYSPCIMKDD
ncbi:SPOR domain-containing protein [Candidatus Hydrogenedentota bacterium]